MNGPAANERRTAMALVLVAAMVLPTVLTWLYFDVFAGRGAANRWQQWTYIVRQIVQIGLPVGFVLWADPGSLWPTRLRFDGLGLALGFAAVVCSAMFLLYFAFLRENAVFAESADKIHAKLDEVDLNSPGRFLGLALFLAVAHSLLEEYYWRWFVFGRLRLLIPFAAALVISSLAFMAHHVLVLHHYFPEQFLTATLPFSLGVACGGGVWCWLYQRTGSIGSTWLSHLLIDAAIFAIAWDMLFVRGG